MAYSYKTGTVSVTNGSATVTGSGTSFQTAGVREGDLFRCNGLTVRIGAPVTSATSVTLAHAWPGGSGSAISAWEIEFVDDDSQAYATALEVLSKISSGNVYALSGLAGAANKAPIFTGSGVMGLMTVSPAALGLLDDANAAAMIATLGLDDIYAKLLPTDGSANLGGPSNRYGNVHVKTSLRLGADDNATLSYFQINGAAGSARRIELQTASSARWFLQASTGAESGSNAGSDFQIIRRADDGSNIGTPLTIGRADGVVTFAQPPKLPSYTVGTLPAAASYARCLVYVSNGTSNKRMAISDGTDWRWPDGAVVS